jgi:murein DD-endopeptidase MepM/ murein hydrolase activator NlpD
VRLKVTLPFPSDQTWRVVQGWSSAAGTHKGSAAFSLDFHPAPSGGTGEVTAAAAGRVVQVVDDDDGEGNFIVVEHHPSLLGAYLHNAKGSSKRPVGQMGLTP